MYNILNNSKKFKSFLKVDELNKELIRICGKNLINLGKTNLGNEILCAKLGYGKENALVFGYPHPNEAIGGLTCLSLTRAILKDKNLQEKYTWYIIPCADPDGVKLNESYYKKFNLKNYIYGFYRSKDEIQTDWSFPVVYKNYKFSNSPSNVKILSKLIKNIKPSLVFPLHNSGFSGSYFFISKKLDVKFYREIFNLSKNLKISLDMGEPEEIYMKDLKKPVYMDFTIEDDYEHYIKTKKNPLKILDYGNSSIGYAREFNKNVFGLTVETGYFYDSNINKKKLTNKTRRENLIEAIEIKTEIINFIDSVIKNNSINKRSIFYSTLIEHIEEHKDDYESDLHVLQSKEFSKKASVSEYISSVVRSKFDNVLLLGELRRLLIESRSDKKSVKFVEERIARIIKDIKKSSKIKSLDIDRSVKLQLGSLLIALDYI